MRVLAAIVLACLCAFGATACTSRSAPARPEPLAAVSPMPNPSLAPWIEEISPTGTADENAQIRIRFRNDVIPVESLESPDRAAAPLATRLRVTLKAGLADLKGNKLDADLAWTFATTPIAISGLPAQEKGADAPTVDLRPEIEVDSNVALNPASLEERAVLMPADAPDAAPIPLSLVTPDRRRRRHPLPTTTPGRDRRRPRRTSWSRVRISPRRRRIASSCAPGCGRSAGTSPCRATPSAASEPTGR